MILNQPDYIKKQNDIIKFVITYTREANIDEHENEHWRYCIKTNIKLLPLFIYTTAQIFLNNINNPNEYYNQIQLLIKNIGKTNEDGDKIIDKHSGWFIQNIDFNYDEGYTESGFKISFSALESDVIINSIKEIPTSETTKKIINIIDTISNAMSINIEIQKEFIVKCVNLLLEENDEKTYIKQIKKLEKSEKSEKQKISYKDYYNSFLLFYTAGMILISIQTSIPSIKTNKTFPGCIKSFSGFPFESSDDFSSLNYLSCILFQIKKTSSEPWNVLKGKEKNQEYISNKIKILINTKLINLIEVKRKIEEKFNNLLENQNIVEISEEYNLLNWIHFLPPLIPFKIKSFENISQAFNENLVSKLKSGSSEQRLQILVIKSKIIQFSLSLQEKINEIIKKELLLLQSSNYTFFLENSCCDDYKNAIEYFIKKNKSIKDDNNKVVELVKLMSDINSYSKTYLFCSKINTKNIYLSQQNTFSETIIYLVFIHFCNFKSILPIPNYLLSVCPKKPDGINKNDTVPEIIKKLKDNNINYSNETFLNLLQLIHANNINNIKIDSNIISPINEILEILKYIKTQNDDIFIQLSKSKETTNFIDLFIKVFTKFEKPEEKITSETRDLNNFLSSEIDNMKIIFLKFIKNNLITNKTKKDFQNITNFINDGFDNWEIEKDSTYNIINFFKIVIDNFTIVFPNIILNKINYQDIVVPNYWKLSSHHSSNIQKIVKDYYNDLRIFYENPELNNILQLIKQKLKHIILLSKKHHVLNQLNIMKLHYFQ